MIYIVKTRKEIFRVYTNDFPCDKVLMLEPRVAKYEGKSVVDVMNYLRNFGVRHVCRIPESVLEHDLWDSHVF